MPLVLLPQLDPGELEWTIPGWQAEKIAALLHDLPKATRKEIADSAGTIADVARDLARRLVPFTEPMLPALARALSELLSSRVTADLFRPETVPRHLRFYFRITREASADSGKSVVAEGRDLTELQARLGARARDALKGAAPLRAEEKAWERNGVTQWDFGPLAPFLVRRVGGINVRAYPAVVDNGKSVDLALLESAAAAEEASRKGVRRLFMLAGRGNLSSIAPRLPRALARPDGAMPTRARNDVFQATLLARIVDAAFALEGSAPLPRSKEAFLAQLHAGLPKLDGLFRQYTSALSIVALELDKMLEALKSAAQHPSGRAAVLDLQTQMEALVPEDLLATISLARLEHYPRYLRAARTRLARAVVDPRKDADKLAPVAALWASFVEKKKRAVDATEIERSAGSSRSYASPCSPRS